MTDAEKRALWTEATVQGRSGASNIGYMPAPVPWRFRQKVLDFLKPESRLLEMEAGDGAFLLALRHPFSLTSLTVSDAAALDTCERRLAPLGVTVRQSTDGVTLPFADASFDLVLNRCAAYDIGAVRRVLQPGGYCILEQVGGSDGLSLRRFLGLPAASRPDFNLENEIPRFQRAGFSINYKDQCYGTARFADVAAFVRYAAANPRQFPAFSVDACFPQLLRLDALCARQGYLPYTQHRFCWIARKRKDG